MCFGGPSVPDTSEELAQQEATRAAKVRQSSDVINRQFDTKFGPSYYGGLGDAYRNYYQPQIATQFKDAERATHLRTADNPFSSSTNREVSNLARDHAQSLQDVESGALDAQNQAKQDVENKRGSLLNLAEAGSSVENAAAQSRAAASTDIGRPTYSPLGDVFGRYAGTLSNAAQASNAGYQVNPVYQKQIDFLRGGKKSGSSTVIGG